MEGYRISSVAWDEETWKILVKIPSRKRSQFIRNLIKANAGQTVEEPETETPADVLNAQKRIKELDKQEKNLMKYNAYSHKNEVKYTETMTRLGDPKWKIDLMKDMFAEQRNLQKNILQSYKSKIPKGLRHESFKSLQNIRAREEIDRETNAKREQVIGYINSLVPRRLNT